MATALPLVEWFGARARVVCPLCGAIRDLAAKDIKRRIARGRFTGRCLKCHVVGTFRGGLPFPAEGAVDWLSATPRPDPWEPNRRRLMVPISCPACSNERWLPTSYVATRVRAGLFDPRCRRHRVTNQQHMLTER
jgi:hypothetical protein